MSTHAAIIQQTPTGDYRGIYLHHDGYPSHAGHILQEHYTTDEAVDALIDLGDLSGIDKTPETCEAYHRDRGEELRIRGAEHLTSLAARIDWSYLYLWEEGEWHAMNRNEWREFVKDQIEQAEAAAGWDPNP